MHSYGHGVESGQPVTYSHSPLSAITIQSLNGHQRALLESLARWHGLIDPMVQGQGLTATRTDGVLAQSINESSGTVTLSTTARPNGNSGPSLLDPQAAMWLEKLARIHGLIDPQQTTANGRTDGTLTQTFSEVLGNIVVQTV